MLTNLHSKIFSFSSTVSMKCETKEWIIWFSCIYNTATVTAGPSHLILLCMHQSLRNFRFLVVFMYGLRTHSVWASSWSTVPNFICKRVHKHEEQFFGIQSLITLDYTLTSNGIDDHSSNEFEQNNNKIGGSNNKDHVIISFNPVIKLLNRNTDLIWSQIKPWTDFLQFYRVRTPTFFIYMMPVSGRHNISNEKKMNPNES